MAFADSANRTMYDSMRPDEKPAPVPKPVRDTDFGSNPPRRKAQDIEEDLID